MKYFLICSLPLFLFLQCGTTKELNNANNNLNEKSKTMEMDMYKTSWVWQHTQNKETKIEPRNKDKFTIRFEKERIDITTDCNGMSATYQMENGDLKLTDFISTRMYCVDSQESEYSFMLQNANKYEVSEDGSLLKIILNDESVMFFDNMNK